ncbi:MAG: hypothetical protein ACI89J_002106 [Hyphomicrobiaceae bacterium]|jgi:hypothetical protein
MPRQSYKTPSHLIPIRIHLAGKTLKIRPVAIHEAGHLLVAIEHGVRINHAALRQPCSASGWADVDVDMLSRRKLGYVRRKSFFRRNGQLKVPCETFAEEVARLLTEVEIKIAGRIAIDVVTGDRELSRKGSKRDYAQARRVITQHVKQHCSAPSMSQVLVRKILLSRECSVRSLLSKRLDDLLRLASELDARQYLDGAVAVEIAKHQTTWIFSGTLRNL